MTTVENNTETVAAQTVRQFFDNLTHGTVVTPNDGGSQYIYTGYHHPTHDTAASVGIVSMRYAEVTFLTEIDGPATNEWQIAKVEVDGEMVTHIVDLSVRRMATALVQNNIYTTSMTQQIDTLQRENRTVRGDFETLNEKINEYAEDQGMCSDYERRIFGWNDDLTTMKLIGRERNYDVQVQFNGFNDSNYISISARSPEGARELVREMDADDLFRSMVRTGQSFDVEWEVVGADAEG